MFDFENMSIDLLQRFANGSIVVVILIGGLALVAVGVIAVRMTKRDTRRHKEAIALLTAIRNELSKPQLLDAESLRFGQSFHLPADPHDLASWVKKIHQLDVRYKNHPPTPVTLRHG